MNNIITEIELKYNPVTGKEKRVKITCPDSAYKAFLDSWNMDTIELYEEFKIILLNRANEVLGIYNLSKGGISGTIVDLKLLFAVVLKSAASGIILAHNHPSGNLTASEADKRLHEKIKRVAKYLDIQVLDNLILCKDKFYSINA